MGVVFKNQEVHDRYCWHNIWYPVVCFYIFMRIKYYSEISLTMNGSCYFWHIVNTKMWHNHMSQKPNFCISIYIYYCCRKSWILEMIFNVLRITILYHPSCGSFHFIIYLYKLKSKIKLHKMNVCPYHDGKVEG